MNDIRYRLITRKYKEFFFPVLFIAMAKYLTSFVDAALVGTFLGVEKMTVINLCLPVVAFVSLFHGMFGIGGSLIAVNAQADHDRDKASRVFSVAISVIVLIGIFAALVGTVFRPRIVAMICSDPSMQKDVADYYSVLVLGFPLECLLLSLSYFTRADGSPKLTSWSLVISNAVNLLMDCVLMGCCGIGLAGAASATIIGYVCGITFMTVGYVRSPRRQFCFVTPFPAGAGGFFDDIKNICINGFSTASVWLYLMASVGVMNGLIIACGSRMDLEAFSICKTSVNLCYIFFLGAAQTMSPIVSVYAHNGDYDKARFVLKRSIRFVLVVSVIMGGLFALFPQGLLLMYGVSDPLTADYLGNVVRIYTLAFPGLAFTFLMNYYFQAIRKQKLSTGITILEGLILPVGLACLLTPQTGVAGVWTALVATEVIAALFIIIYLRTDRRRSRACGERRFLLPAQSDHGQVVFSVEMDISEVVLQSEEVSRYMEDRTDRRTASITGLALEEMLTGIVLANKGKQDVIDVMLQETEEEIVISIRDMGVGFNPLLRDEALAYDFDNAMVLQKIASDIRYDLSLGMNDTMIRIKKVLNQAKVFDDSLENKVK